MSETVAPSHPKHVELLEALSDQVELIKTTDGWHRWIETAVRFRTYSLSNQLLIMRQRPDSTRVAGYTTWREVGRQVRKGERGIAIVAPVRVKSEASDGEPGYSLRGFRIVHVFDISQTEGEPIPTLDDTKVKMKDPSLLPRLIAAAEAQNIQVTRTTHHDPTVHGWWLAEERTITLVETFDDANQARTMLHELAHACHSELGDAEPFEAHRAIREIIAESAAFIVGTAVFGINMVSASSTYVASWSDWQPDSMLIRIAARRTLDVAKALEALVGPAIPSVADSTCRACSS